MLSLNDNLIPLMSSMRLPLHLDKASVICVWPKKYRLQVFIVCHDGKWVTNGGVVVVSVADEGLDVPHET